MKIAYTFVVADLLHFGHLQLLVAARKSCDRLVCGVLTDEAVVSFRGCPISNYEERKSVVESIRYVDEVMPQTSQDPTENLKQIKAANPGAEILFVYGDNWKNVPGEEYIRSANVKTIKQHFYARLSNENISYKIIETTLPDRSVFETFTSEFTVKDFEVFRKQRGERPRHIITTKAKTLQTLKPLLKKSYIEKTYVITVKEWMTYRNEILYSIRDKFSGDRIVVRSSCLNEDSLTSSKAGHYHSRLNVNPQNSDEVSAAINDTIASYGPSMTESRLDQILIQRQATDIVMSGVVFTHDLQTSSPYYVINYDITGKTDTVTAGLAGSLAKVFRNTESFRLIQPWRDIIEAVREIEEIIPEFDLDMEFGVTRSGRVVLFQVRPLAANKAAEKKESALVEHSLRAIEARYQELSRRAAGSGISSPVFSDMLFWNPAELVGHCPSNLGCSIFEKILMSRAWNQGIRQLGYPDLLPRALMECFLYKPYINVNLAFLALIPRKIPEVFHERLQSWYLAKLRADHSLHDKAEFEIMFTCYDFYLRERLRPLEDSSFSPDETRQIHDGLLAFTKDIFRDYRSIYADLRAKIDDLDAFNRAPFAHLVKEVQAGNGMRLVCEMLEKCEEYGTVPFAAAARLAFIGDALVRSLVEAGVISKDERDLIMNSFSTVATDLTCALGEVADGRLSVEAFLQKYGHLRSGTYDIGKPRYDRIDPAMWQKSRKVVRGTSVVPAELQEKIDRFVQASSLGISYRTLYDFVSLFIAAREHFKFVYTRTVSNVLQLVEEAGKTMAIAPEDLSFLKFEQLDLLFSGQAEPLAEIVADARRNLAQNALIDLPPLVFGIEDFRIIEYPLSRPNFVTGKAESGEVVVLDKTAEARTDIDDKIVFIENADPGYHWIFSRRIKGLVTKYGGAASHMAICCAEFNIPAAIGCGEKYDKLVHCKTVTLDCSGKTIREAL